MPAERTARLFNLDKEIALLLASLYGAEIAQGLQIFPGTFDPGDLVAYTAGGVLMGALHRMRENRIRNYIDHQVKNYR